MLGARSATMSSSKINTSVSSKRTKRLERKESEGMARHPNLKMKRNERSG